MDANDYLTIGSVRDGSALQTGEGIRNGGQPTNLTIKAFALKDGVQQITEAGVEYVEYNTFGGFGSSATKIPYYLNEVRNTASDYISVENDSTNGFSITALQPCVVTMDLTYSDDAALDAFGITLNATELTSGIGNQSVLSVRKAIEYVPVADGAGQASVTIDMELGDVLRPHGDGSPTGGAVANHHVVVTARPYARNLITKDIQIAYLKDVQTEGTSGGTATLGAWRTRELNTVEGDTYIVTLDSNQFTLGAGTYHIEASCPARDVQIHKAKLYNVTDSSDVIYGTSASASSSDLTDARTNIIGVVEITSSKTFEIQHRVTATSADAAGFGSQTSGFSAPEVYTIVKITKVK